MVERNETSKPADARASSERSSGAGNSPPWVGAGDVGRHLSFWSAILLPFVAIAVLVVQPPSWLPALGAVFSANAVALYAGHCHDLRC